MVVFCFYKFWLSLVLEKVFFLPSITNLLVIIPISKINIDYGGQSKAYLEPSRTSKMELFCKNSQQLKAVNYSCKKTPSYMFDWVLNTPLAGIGRNI